MRCRCSEAPVDGNRLDGYVFIHICSELLLRRLSMNRPDTLQGALPLLVLKILVRRGPMHGYAMTSHIESMSEEVLRVMEGSLYPALHRMEEAGWIKARWSKTEHKRRARIYEITPAGRRQLEAEEARWQAVTGAVGYILKHA
jgi:PadR family transcriptional regulator PadR